jgi:transposase
MHRGWEGGDVDMSYYQVSDENMQKVEAYFVKRIREVGSTRLEATVVDIADGSGVALATAHKAIKQLAQEKRITIIKPNSRRFPITYVYNGSIEGFVKKQTAEEQIEYLQNLIQELQSKLDGVTKERNELRGLLNICQNKAQ